MEISKIKARAKEKAWAFIGDKVEEKKKKTPKFWVRFNSKWAGYYGQAAPKIKMK